MSGFSFGFSSMSAAITGGVVPPVPYPTYFNLDLMPQSWNSGRVTTMAAYTPAGMGARLFGNDDVMKVLADPIDSAVGQVDAVSADSNAAGSFVPLMASRFLAKHTDIPMVVRPHPKGGVSVVACLPGANHENPTTLYGSMMRRIKLSGLPSSFADIMIGQVDADNQMTKETFKAHIKTIADNIMIDAGCKLMVGKWPTPKNATTLARLGPIWAAIDELWAEGGNILKGADLSAVTADDDFHILYACKNGWEADQRLKAYQAALGLPVGPLPSINNIPKSNQFDQWAVNGVSLTPNAAPNPLTGAMDAALVTVTNPAVVQKGITSLAFSILAGQMRTHSVYIKSIDPGVQWVQLYGSQTGFGPFFKNFDIINGVEGIGVQGASGGVSGCIERVGTDGWLRIQAATNTAAANPAAAIVINPINGNINQKGTNGPASGSFLIYAPQNEVRENAGDYVDNP